MPNMPNLPDILLAWAALTFKSVANSLLNIKTY